VTVPPTNRGRFDVWAPLPSRVRLSVGEDVVGMTRDEDGWWTPTDRVPGGIVDFRLHRHSGKVENINVCGPHSSQTLK